MQIHTVKDPVYRMQLPPLPFTLVLESPDDWQSFLDAYPELIEGFYWGSIGGTNLRGKEYRGFFRYFHTNKTVQWSSDLDQQFRHYEQFRWPS